jgi:hypothetical protein
MIVPVLAFWVIKNLGGIEGVTTGHAYRGTAIAYAWSVVITGLRVQSVSAHQSLDAVPATALAQIVSVVSHFPVTTDTASLLP